MSASTPIERAHYAKLVGRHRDHLKGGRGQELPSLLLNGWDRDGNASTASVLMNAGASGSQPEAGVGVLHLRKTRCPTLFFTWLMTRRAQLRTIARRTGLHLRPSSAVNGAAVTLAGTRLQ